MTRRGRIGIGIGVAALALPPAAWLISRPRIPVEFVGLTPPGHFVFKEEFVGKPIVDFKLPGGYKLTYPKKRKLAIDSTDANAICGYFELDQPVKLWGRGVSFNIGGKEVATQLSYVDDPVATTAVKTSTPLPAGTIVVRGRSPSSSSTITYFTSTGGVSFPGTSKALIPIPYAIDEAHRDVTLAIESKEYKLRLPVTKALGPSIRKPILAKFGPYEINIKASPWLLSTQTVEFSAKSNVKGKMKLMLETKWDRPSTSSFYSPNMTDTIIFEEGFEYPFLFPRYLEGKSAAGFVYELAETKIKLRAKRATPKSSPELYLEDGRCIYGGQAGSQFGHYGYKALVVKGKFISDSPRVQRQGRHVSNFHLIKDGEIIDAVGYKVVNKWPIKLDFDIPPPMKNGPGHFIFSRGGGSYIISSPVAPVSPKILLKP